MVTAMTPQGNRLLSLLQNPDSETFAVDLAALLDEFTASTTGTYGNPFLVTLDENVKQSLPLVNPLLDLLSSGTEVPYAQITRALSALLAPLQFEDIRSMGLYPVMQQGLHSDIPDLQILALEQAQKMTELDDGMVSSLIECLGAEDASVGKKAVDVITHVYSYFVGADSSYSLTILFRRPSSVLLKRPELRCKSLDSST
jgi:hypothetical protein